MAGPPSGHRNRASKNSAEAEQRRLQIWQMRVDGNTEQQIAEHFGITRQRVGQIITEAFQERREPVIAELRQVAADKLDQMEKTARAIVARHEDHDDPVVLAALDRINRVEQRRAAMFGYDAPVKSEVTSYEYTVNGVDPDALK